MPAYAVSGAFRIRASPRGGIGKAGGSSVRAPPAGPVSLVVRASGGGACADGEVRRVVVRVAAVRPAHRRLALATRGAGFAGRRDQSPQWAECRSSVRGARRMSAAGRVFQRPYSWRPGHENSPSERGGGPTLASALRSARLPLGAARGCRGAFGLLLVKLHPQVACLPGVLVLPNSHRRFRVQDRRREKCVNLGLHPVPGSFAVTWRPSHVFGSERLSEQT